MQSSRRSFVTGLAAPLILGAGDKSGSRAPVLGSGEHTYEALHDWGELPANIKYGNTHGVWKIRRAIFTSTTPSTRTARATIPW